MNTALGAVCSFLNGGTPARNVDHFYRGHTPWITGADIESRVVNDARSFITDEAIKKSATNLVPPGTVLLVTRTSVGKVAVAGVSLCFSQDITAITPDVTKLDPGYLVHFLQTQKSHFERAARGATIQGVTRETVENIQIPLPPLPEQRRIATILDRADALRAKRREAIKKLDDLTQSIFLDMFGDPTANSKGWPVVPIGGLLTVPPNYGTMIPPSSREGPWLSLRVVNIQEWQLDLSDAKFVDLPVNEMSRHSVQDGDVLLARAIASREHLGKAIVAYPRDQRWAFDSHLMRLRADRRKLEPEFLRHLLKTPGGRSLFLQATRRSAVQFNINTKEMSQLCVPVAPIGLQCTFSKRVASIEVLEGSARQALHRADDLFKCVQHRAFHGEL